MMLSGLFSAAAAQSTFIDKESHATMISASYLLLNVDEAHGQMEHCVGGSLGISYRGILDMGGSVALAKTGGSKSIIFAPQAGLYPARLKGGPMQVIPGLFSAMQISNVPLIWSIGLSLSIDIKISRIISYQPSFAVARLNMPEYDLEQMAAAFGFSFAFHVSPGVTYLLAASLSSNKYSNDA